MDYTKNMNDQGSPINSKLKKVLNSFFSKHPECAERCILRKDFNHAPYSLIIEESDLYYHLQGEYGWSIHTAFHDAFKGSDWYFEPQNSCVINFYKD